jgi:UDP-N-acetylmuramoyl-tripeptide--D-alanyl-D-alanine ligase
VSAPAERLGATTRFTLPELLAATGGELASAGGAIEFRGVTSDSRALAEGELFVALRGETHDGHAFVAQAAARGAAAVLVEHGATTGDVPCGVVSVRDTLAALGDLAGWHRRRSPATVLAVAGSNGKTTTKEMLAEVLRHAFGSDAVLQTVGTQNNLVGLPFTLLRLGRERVAVVELGMNGPGEVWRLAAIAAPDAGVITCVAPEHLEGVGSLHGAAEAEAELFRRLRPSATAVVNVDDPLVAEAAACVSGRVLRFGTGGDVRADDVVDRGYEGTSFTLRIGDQETPVRLPIPGRHNVTNALAAAAMAHVAGAPLAAIRSGLEAFTSPGMRMEVVRLRSGVTVLNDAYNANPASMAAALQTLTASAAGRRLAALGDMLELGDATEDAHRELGAVAAAANLDALFLLGAHAALIEAGALAAGMARERILCGTDHETLGRALSAACRAGDLVLLKGSRGSAMEKLLVALRSEGG